MGVSTDVLGPRQKHQMKDWLSVETYAAIEARRAVRNQVLCSNSEETLAESRTRYSEANRMVKRLACKDKREYVEQMANKAEEAARRGDQGELYKITKLVCGKYHNTSNAPVRIRMVSY